MTYNIRREEFLVLSYLHEHAEGYDPDFSFDLNQVAEGTGLTVAQTRKAGSYLSSLVLAVLTDPAVVTYGNEDTKVIFLTGQGEEFMRQLEDQLYEVLATAPAEGGGKVTTITTKVGGFVYDTGKAVIVKVLADWMTGR